MDGIYVEAGASFAQDHGSGVWYQKGFPYTKDLDSIAWSIGYRWASGVSLSYRQLAEASSTAVALTNDVDYDPAGQRCISNCDQLGTFITKGRVDAVAVGYEHRFGGGWLASIDALLYRPQFSVSLRDYRSRDANGVPYGPVAADYVNKSEVRVGVAIGVGYEFGHWAVIARGYPSLQSAGDRRAGDTFESLSSLTKRAFTLTVRYTF